MSSIAIAACTLALLACGAAPARQRPAAHPERPQSSARSLAATGLEHLRRGDSLRAEQYLVLAIREGYPERELIVPLLEACLTASRLQSALRHAEPYLRRHPSAWRLRYVVAALQLGLGDAERARATLREGGGARSPTLSLETSELRAWLEASAPTRGER